ncbi:hypothetical protein [Alicyclobacillus fodiniaquatilis]|uniref:Uncharacterized protein n=1 Tax=Alicyclobacillus fodiniaquatilis TaxID=1661150 RepID=A0ABW4JR13_9BACL
MHAKAQTVLSIHSVFLAKVRWKRQDNYTEHFVFGSTAQHGASQSRQLGVHTEGDFRSGTLIEEISKELLDVQLTASKPREAAPRPKVCDGLPESLIPCSLS